MRLLAIGALVLFPAVAAAHDPSAKPLPGNKPCPYPAEAQKEHVAGPVHFSVQVRPDGTAESVEVSKVPKPGVGFEETVRACVSEWRFEPAPAGETASRRYQGRFRFRLDAAEESAIRFLLETLAAAWNAGSMTVLEDLGWRSGDAPAAPALAEQLRRERSDPWRMELEPDVEQLRFLEPDLVSVMQPYRRMVTDAQSGQAKAQEATLGALVAKGSRGWRFEFISALQTAPLEGVRVGGAIREPRKVKDAKPRYPEAARASRIQGVVILECVISPSGKVASVRVLRGIPELDAAAIEAVRQWEYTPTLLEGVPVPMIMTVTVNFRLT